MQSKNSIGLTVVLAAFAVTLLITGTWAAAQEKVLHNFNSNGSAAFFPYAGLVSDAAGNLYGTTFYGGPDNYGTVFELMPTTGGGWTEKTLHSFTGTDGFFPEANLIVDTAGNLYGTISAGSARGGGTAFELTPKTGGGWTEEILHNFGNGKDGSSPGAGLIMDTSGNLYGTTRLGGGHSVGTVFELTPRVGGGWVEKTLHSFNNNGTDGYTPLAGLIMDASGNLYGTTYLGGIYGSSNAGGTVFELTPAAGGTWTETVLHSFNNGTDGAQPEAGLILDAAGDLYGTTLQGGVYGYGTVFELTPGLSGSWSESVLHDFSNGSGGDGAYPVAGLVFDTQGNLYGTTQQGGPFKWGVVFKLAPATGGSWTETVLHAFGNGKDAQRPQGTLIFGASGNLYGATEEGGAYGEGTVFEITP
jgi:uncharacterized repeat protein (TIGR03803 family)